MRRAERGQRTRRNSGLQETLRATQHDVQGEKTPQQKKLLLQSFFDGTLKCSPNDH